VPADHAPRGAGAAADHAPRGAGVAAGRTSLLSGRLNVYDGDEFDVFTRTDVDVGRVHRGKQRRAHGLGRAAAAEDALDAAVRARCVAYGYDDDYDDEYDDTYDSVIAARDADSMDELTSRRPVVTPRVLQNRPDRRANNRWQQEEEEEEPGGGEDDDDGGERGRESGRGYAGAGGGSAAAFLEDPAVLRQRREQQRLARRAAPSSGCGEEAGAAGRGRGGRDVRGVGRGHGQTGEVVRSRAWKEKNRASRVHHNRKDLAERKRRV